ncbi:MAG: hypothetical protein AB7N24_13015 [Dehalococcoidia bacterium]
MTQPAGEQRAAAIRDFRDRLGQSVTELAAKTPVHLFIMGPAPDADSQGARLRKELVGRAKADGYSAFAEHPEIKDAVGSALGDEVDLCTVELNFAARVDLLVFIPCSPGSFAELGYFAALASRGKKKPLGPKSIVLVDHSFKDSKNFVLDGPVQLMREAKANVNYVDYGDAEAAWGILTAAISAERRRKVREQVTG